MRSTLQAPVVLADLIPSHAHTPYLFTAKQPTLSAWAPAVGALSEGTAPAVSQWCSTLLYSLLHPPTPPQWLQRQMRWTAVTHKSEEQSWRWILTWQGVSAPALCQYYWGESPSTAPQPPYSTGASGSVAEAALTRQAFIGGRPESAGNTECKAESLWKILVVEQPPLSSPLPLPLALPSEAFLSSAPGKADWIVPAIWKSPS